MFPMYCGNLDNEVKNNLDLLQTQSMTPLAAFSLLFKKENTKHMESF